MWTVTALVFVLQLQSECSTSRGPLMATVHASALIRLLWTCRLIAEEARQVITFESLIVQTGGKKNTVQGGSDEREVKITCMTNSSVGNLLIRKDLVLISTQASIMEQHFGEKKSGKMGWSDSILGQRSPTLLHDNPNIILHTVGDMFRSKWVPLISSAHSKPYMYNMSLMLDL